MFDAFKAALTGHNRALRRRIVAMAISLGAANVALWAVAAVVFHAFPVLLGTCVLAYTFGLRHAVDADHIAAIDNVTRKLMQEGKRPLGVGFFFSIGHSTVVFCLSAVVALSAAAVKDRFEPLANAGAVFGTLVSACFLVALAVMNLLVLKSIVATFRRVKAGGAYSEDEVDLLLSRRGLLSRLCRRLFGMVGSSWQMYLVGFLFGLGFDTATEVGLLGISAAQANQGLPIWSIMLFPALFTAGMALVDTADSILMLGAYGWAFAKPLRKLYYNIAITSVSVAVALGVGALETLGLVRDWYNPSGRFWDSVAKLTDDGASGMIGFAVIGIFALSWIVSMLIFKAKRYDEIEADAAG